MLREKFSLPNLATHVSEGSSVPRSVADYFTTMLDQSLDWKRAEAIRKQWDGPFCLKGIAAVAGRRQRLAEPFILMLELFQRNALRLPFPRRLAPPPRCASFGPSPAL